MADNDDGHDSDEVMTSIQSIPYEEPLQMTAPIIRCKAWMNDPVGVSEYVWYLKLQSTWEAQSEKVISHIQPGNGAPSVDNDVYDRRSGRSLRSY